MPKIFERAGMRKPRYSAFDLSREQKLTMRMGELVPTFLEEIVPGDNFKVRTESMIRLAPMLAPVMHRVNVYMHYFFVPNRLVWNQWEEFITGGREGTSSPTFPVATLNETAKNGEKLLDYMGIPRFDFTSGNNVEQISALPLRAYQLIWSEYFRDPNIEPEIDPNNLQSWQNFELRYRAWEKDYFTSALPWSQRGPATGVPIDVSYHEDGTRVQRADGGNVNADGVGTFAGTPESRFLRTDGSTSTPGENLILDNLDTDGVNVDINNLRTASALQRWLETSARGGYRYIEQLLSHFGVRSDDARLQRPEYLGGGRQPIVISEVLNTTGTEQAPQGDMAGHGISTGTTNSFNKTFKEHGYVFGIMSVLPKTGYQQGIHRHWNRRDKTDFYFPEFAHLGEQEILNKELYYADDEDNNETFGYQQRYAEYKYGNSTVHGDFRTNLDFWHLGRIFENRPQLNAPFMVSKPSDRIFAVEDEDHLWIQLYHDVKARRPMPHFANPSLR